MSEIKFCVVDGCHEVAIGTRRSRDHCREHYVAEVLDKADLVRCEVVGPCPITDARTTKGVTRGGLVELDPDETHIAQLVYAGHVKVLPAAKPASQPAAKPAAAKPEAAKD
ncbi:MAG: hypothetical protein ACREXJ_00155 [Gammaproteobacteria bacterium]